MTTDRLQVAKQQQNKMRRLFCRTYGRAEDCIYKRAATGEKRYMTGCRSAQHELELFGCELHGVCSQRQVLMADRSIRDKSIASCNVCPDWA